MNYAEQNTNDLWAMLKQASQNSSAFARARAQLSGPHNVKEIRRLSAQLSESKKRHEAIRQELINRGEIKK